MTTKEKAIEIANRFTRKSVFEMDNDELKVERVEAKKAALTCVDEILNGSRLFYIEDYDYWKEVRQEISLL